MSKWCHSLMGFFIGTCVSGSVTADSLECDNGLAIAHGPGGPHLNMVCKATDSAIAALDRCALSKPDQIHIHVQDHIESACLGVFHCGTNQIDVLSPDAMTALRSDSGSFAHLEAERLFQSVIVHEFAHAAFDATPCPYDQCVASSEYFAYAIQVMELSDEDRAPIEASTSAKTDVGHDSINAFLLFMSPETFVTNVWAHLNDRPDQCTYLRGLQEGIFQFDRFHP